MFSTSLWHAGLLKRGTWVIMQRALGMVNGMSEEHPRRAHHYVEYIGVVPDCQGQGMGSLIAESIVQKSDQERVGAYLETASPWAVPLYQRVGFEVTREKGLLGVPMWFMWRDPVDR